ncbi:MAG: hypothetical protein ACP5QT_07215 [Brevinematia bacterium]
MRQKVANTIDDEKFQPFLYGNLKLSSVVKRDIFLKCNSSIEVLNFVYNSISEVKNLIDSNEKEEALKKLLFLTSRLKKI